jgi:hypothetical protein
VDGRLVLNTSALILNAALAGFGLTHLIELQVQKHLDSGELGRVLVNWCPPYSAVHPLFVGPRGTTAPIPLPPSPERAHSARVPDNVQILVPFIAQSHRVDSSSQMLLRRILS